MKLYNIKINFTLTEKDYKRYSRNIDTALNLILPYGEDVEIKEVDYEEEED